VRHDHVAILSLLTGLIATSSLAAQEVAPAFSTAPSIELPANFDGPPVPVAPATMSRNAEGRATLRAVRLTEPLGLDGELSEGLYATVKPISDFIQVEPRGGAPATEKTEVWVTFDDNYVYVSFRCWESQPERLIANEMRRDNTNLVMGNDNVAFLFDTFHDRRNAFLFEVNPLGGRFDGQVTNESQNNSDWNPVWDVQTGRFEQGWTLEAAIPFKSLRYQPGRAQIWGFNARRRNAWKNEVSFITQLPNARGMMATFQVSGAATLVGIDAPPGSKNLEIKPYVVTDVTSDVNANIDNEVGGDIGLDVKYGLTQNLTADFTYNTDFAQVEADQLQINLTRFNLFFPEKREFFLENQGIFSFGGAAAGGFAAVGSDTPVLFYSRRIGLNEGREVPIDAGGRLTGRPGRFSIGVLNIQSDDEPTSGARRTNFSVVRVKRNILRKSSIGVIATGRSVGDNGTGSNTAYGADGIFAFYDNLTINTYWAQTRTTALSRDDASYRAQLDYAGDRYGLQLERLVVGSNFNPEVGFVRRDDMHRWFGQFRFSPRPRNSETVRKYSWTESINYVENGEGRVETRDLIGEFGVEFQSSDEFNLVYTNNYEFLPSPFPIAPGVTIPVGVYDTQNVGVGFTFARRRRLAGSISAEYGTFYSGTKTTVTVSQGRVGVSPQLSIEPTYSLNKVELVEGDFTSHLAGARVTYTMTPLMFTSALLQYDSSRHTVSANVRLRWEYRPGSELFIVYNDQRDSTTPGFPDLTNRALIVKINRLFRF
jgi:Domain of unknown function (DUF5916)